MSKSSKQLDKEIAAALSRISDAPAKTGDFYYAVYPDDEHLKLYGPYETWKDAAFAGYFNKSAEERERLFRRTSPIHFFANGVEQHNEDEIQVLTRYPHTFKFKSVKIVHRAPPRHASWKSLHAKDAAFAGSTVSESPFTDEEYLQHTRNRDWKLTGRDS